MREDLAGRQYGELTVVRYAGSDPATRGPLYLCRCSCGVEKEIPGYALTHGHYRSCGCKQAEKRDAGAKRHIEQDATDGTRRSALRAKLHAGNKSGVKGVRWVAARNKWQAYIGFQGKQITLGYFADKDAAISARREAEKRYHDPYK